MAALLGLLVILFILASVSTIPVKDTVNSPCNYAYTETTGQFYNADPRYKRFDLYKNATTGRILLHRDSIYYDMYYQVTGITANVCPEKPGPHDVTLTFIIDAKGDGYLEAERMYTYDRYTTIHVEYVELPPLFPSLEDGTVLEEVLSK